MRCCLRKISTVQTRLCQCSFHRFDDIGDGPVKTGVDVRRPALCLRQDARIERTHSHAAACAATINGDQKRVLDAHAGGGP